MRILVFFLILICFSCSTKKDILFIQDSSPKTDYDLAFQDITIDSDDILRIKVSSRSVELAALYSFQNGITNSNTLEGFQIEGYKVDSDGYIKLPSIDPIMVKDLSVKDASDLIQKTLRDKEDIKDATVDVKIVNSYFTILGEVNKPGRYNFLKNNMDIFQALGMAGDLTINGKRDDIKIISKNDDTLNVKSVDLTSSDVLLSKNFQIFPGDIIIINANNARIKNAGVIGNFGNLLSVLSFVLSSLILISNN